MKRILLLYLSVLFVFHINTQQLNLTRDLVHFIKIQSKPTKVVAYLCWTREEKIQLKMRLHKENLLSAFCSIESKDRCLNNIGNSENLFYVMDMNCIYATKLLLKANELGKLMFPHRWIILGNPTEIPSYLDIFVSSRIFVMKENDNNKREVISLYKLNKTRPYIINLIGKYENGKMYNFNSLSDIKNRSNLNGVQMNISLVIINNDTLEHLEDFQEKQKDALTKHNWILVNHLSDILNITRHFRFHNTWGVINPNTSKYNGEIGDLQQHISEIAATPAFIYPHRFAFADFIFEPTATIGRFIFRAPALSMVSNVFTLPFDRLVWYASFLLLVISFVVLFVIIKCERWSENFRNSFKNVIGVIKPDWVEIIQLEIGAVCQQGSEAEPRSGAGRIATFTLFLTFMFLYVSYSANIVALLQSTTDSLKTLEDLLNSRIVLGVEDTPYNAIYKMQTGEVNKAIYREKIQPNNYFEAFVGVKKMRDEYFAFHSEPNTIYQIVNKIFQEHQKCGLKEIQYLNLGRPWIPIKKNSAYKELIKNGYFKLKESGLQKRNFLKLYTKKPLCQNQGANFISVSLYDCYFAFLCFGVGISIALIIFIFENCVSSFKSMQTKKKNRIMLS